MNSFGLWDVHMHSQFSGDSDTPQEDMILAAIDAGLGGICFTDHLDIDYPDDATLFLLDCGSIAAAKEKGLVGLEGKEYVVKDGDVILFRFNV